MQIAVVGGGSNRAALIKALVSLERCSTNTNPKENEDMNPIAKLLSVTSAFAAPGLAAMQMPQPHVRTRAKKYRFPHKPRKQRTTSSSRQILRFQQRLARAYKPGTIGVSAVSAAIMEEFDGDIPSRRVRRFLYGKAFVAFTAGR